MSSPLSSHLDLEIEETVRKEEDDNRKDAWQEWIPEIQEALKDRALAILGDRFKIEYIAQELSTKGMESPSEVLSFIMNNLGQAQQIYPKYMPLDALYKAMRDGNIRPSV